MKTQQLSVTIPEDLVKKAKEMAKKDHRSFSSMISILLREAMEQKEKAA